MFALNVKSWGKTKISFFLGSRPGQIIWWALFFCLLSYRFSCNVLSERSRRKKWAGKHTITVSSSFPYNKWWNFLIWKAWKLLLMIVINENEGMNLSSQSTSFPLSFIVGHISGVCTNKWIASFISNALNGGASSGKRFTLLLCLFYGSGYWWSAIAMIRWYDRWGYKGEQ